MTPRAIRRLLFRITGTASVAAFLLFLGAVWTGPHTGLSDKLGGTGALCAATAFVAAVVGMLTWAGGS